MEAKYLKRAYSLKQTAKEISVGLNELAKIIKRHELAKEE